MKTQTLGLLFVALLSFSHVLQVDARLRWHRRMVDNVELLEKPSSDKEDVVKPELDEDETVVTKPSSVKISENPGDSSLPSPLETTDIDSELPNQLVSAELLVEVEKAIAGFADAVGKLEKHRMGLAKQDDYDKPSSWDNLLEWLNVQNSDPELPKAKQEDAWERLKAWWKDESHKLPELKEGEIHNFVKQLAEVKNAGQALADVQAKIEGEMKIRAVHAASSQAGHVKHTSSLDLPGMFMLLKSSWTEEQSKKHLSLLVNAAKKLPRFMPTRASRLAAEESITRTLLRTARSAVATTSHVVMQESGLETPDSDPVGFLQLGAALLRRSEKETQKSGQAADFQSINDGLTEAALILMQDQHDVEEEDEELLDPEDEDMEVAPNVWNGRQPGDLDKETKYLAGEASVWAGVNLALLPVYEGWWSLGNPVAISWAPLDNALYSGALHGSFEGTNLQEGYLMMQQASQLQAQADAVNSQIVVLNQQVVALQTTVGNLNQQLAADNANMLLLQATTNTDYTTWQQALTLCNQQTALNSDLAPQICASAAQDQLKYNQDLANQNALQQQIDTLHQQINVDMNEINQRLNEIQGLDQLRDSLHQAAVQLQQEASTFFSHMHDAIVNIFSHTDILQLAHLSADLMAQLIHLMPIILTEVLWQAFAFLTGHLWVITVARLAYKILKWIFSPHDFVPSHLCNPAAHQMCCEKVITSFAKLSAKERAAGMLPSTHLVKGEGEWCKAVSQKMRLLSSDVFGKANAMVNQNNLWGVQEGSQKTTKEVEALAAEKVSSFCKEHVVEDLRCGHQESQMCNQITSIIVTDQDPSKFCARFDPNKKSEYPGEHIPKALLVADESVDEEDESLDDTRYVKLSQLEMIKEVDRLKKYKCKEMVHHFKHYKSGEDLKKFKKTRAEVCMAAGFTVLDRFWEYPAADFSEPEQEEDEEEDEEEEEIEKQVEKEIEKQVEKAKEKETVEMEAPDRNPYECRMCRELTLRFVAGMDDGAKRGVLSYLNPRRKHSYDSVYCEAHAVPAMRHWCKDFLESMMSTELTDIEGGILYTKNAPKTIKSLIHDQPMVANEYCKKWCRDDSPFEVGSNAVVQSFEEEDDEYDDTDNECPVSRTLVVPADPNDICSTPGPVIADPVITKSLIHRMWDAFTGKVKQAWRWIYPSGVTLSKHYALLLDSVESAMVAHNDQLKNIADELKTELIESRIRFFQPMPPQAVDLANKRATLHKQVLDSMQTFLEKLSPTKLYKMAQLAASKEAEGTEAAKQLQVWSQTVGEFVAGEKTRVEALLKALSEQEFKSVKDEEIEKSSSVTKWTRDSEEDLKDTVACSATRLHMLHLLTNAYDDISKQLAQVEGKLNLGTQQPTFGSLIKKMVVAIIDIIEKHLRNSFFRSNGFLVNSMNFFQSMYDKWHSRNSKATKQVSELTALTLATLDKIKSSPAELKLNGPASNVDVLRLSQAVALVLKQNGCIGKAADSLVQQELESDEGLGNCYKLLSRTGLMQALTSQLEDQDEETGPTKQRELAHHVIKVLAPFMLDPSRGTSKDFKMFTFSATIEGLDNSLGGLHTLVKIHHWLARSYQTAKLIMSLGELHALECSFTSLALAKRETELFKEIVEILELINRKDNEKTGRVATMKLELQQLRSALASSTATRKLDLDDAWIATDKADKDYDDYAKAFPLSSKSVKAQKAAFEEQKDKLKDGLKETKAQFDLMVRFWGEVKGDIKSDDGWPSADLSTGGWKELRRAEEQKALQKQK